MTRPLPPGFLLGAATSAYQIEGGIENDWSTWEREGRLRARDHRCGRATDHWRRFEEDFDRLVELGAGAYRMSVEWARVEPEPGRFDEAALERYDAMVSALRARGIEPFVTLHHYTNPRWLHERCPWDANGEAPVAAFTRFAEKVVAKLKDRVTRWTILNEPMAWALVANLAGKFPPGRTSPRSLGAAFLNLIRAHAAAARVIRDAGGQAGIAHSLMRFLPARGWSPLDRAAAWGARRAYVDAFTGALTSGVAHLVVPGLALHQRVPGAAGSLDFIGVNYYSRVFADAHGRRVKLFYEDRSGRGVSDSGWESHPEGLTWALMRMHRHGLPLYVTENGLDDRDDSRRSAYLFDHLSATLDARDQGADVRGYLHWSLLDNFEWLEGFHPRFGLYRVDYETQARTPTKAAKLFAEIARARALPAERPGEVKKKGTGRVSPV